MGNGEVLGRHEIEQFCCRLEVDDLVSDENLGISKFVPRLLRFHDPNKSVCLVGKFFFSKEVPKQKIGTDPRLGRKEMYVDLISSFKICADKSPVSML